MMRSRFLSSAGGRVWSVLTLLTLLGQLLLGTAFPMRGLAAADGPFDGVPICHGGGHDDTDAPQPAGQPAHRDDCALCPVCHVLAAVVGLPAPPPSLTPPMLARGDLTVAWPPARGPPTSSILAATYPTGPPILA